MKQPLTKDDKQAIKHTIHRLENIKQELDQIIQGTDQEAEWTAYGRFGLDQLLGNGNPYDRSLHDLLNPSN